MTDGGITTSRNKSDNSDEAVCRAIGSRVAKDDEHGMYRPVIRDKSGYRGSNNADRMERRCGINREMWN